MEETASEAGGHGEAAPDEVPPIAARAALLDARLGAGGVSSERAAPHATVDSEDKAGDAGTLRQLPPSLPTARSAGAWLASAGAEAVADGTGTVGAAAGASGAKTRGGGSRRERVTA